MPKTPTPPSHTNPFLARALEDWQTANTAEEKLRQEAEKDLRFLNLEQWEPEDKGAREDEHKPTLVIDQIGEPYRQLVGQQRQAKPAIQVSPVDNGADQDTAEVFQGLIRHIETTGNAKAARDQAFKSAVGMGWGYYRLLTEYEHDEEPGGDPAAIFDQILTYQAIENPFTVFRDPACPLHEPWKARFCLIIEDVPKEQFKARHPNAIATSQEAFAATGLNMPEWYPEGSVRVADYFYTELKSLPEVALLADGSVVPAKDVPKGSEVLQRRIPTQTVVKLAKITGAEVLEGNEDKTAGREWPGRFIPIIPIYGDSLMVDGKRTLRGIVRAARDPQRMYNYQNSELVYELALSPKSKVLMPNGGQENLEEMWKQSPTKAFPALLWNPYDAQGRQLPPPIVAQFTDATKIQALTVAINQHKADLRSTTGWYDATDPNRRNTDQSGRAILARKEAQSEGAVTYKDNFSAALLFEGKILLDLIPKVYNRPGRILRVLGLEDETQSEEVAIGKPRKGKGGLDNLFKWGTGRYDVVASIGASYTTRRQEAADTSLELMKILAPPQAAVIAPTAVRNMDIPGNRDMADRLDRTLPPEVRNDKQDEADPKQMAQELAQMQAKGQEMMQVIQGLQQAIKTDQLKIEGQKELKVLDLDFKREELAFRREELHEQSEVKLSVAELGAKMDRLALFLEERARVGAEAHQMGMAAAQAGHEGRMAQMGHAQEMESGEREHEQALEQGAMGHQHALEQGEQGQQFAREQAAMQPEAGA